MKTTHSKYYIAYKQQNLSIVLNGNWVLDTEYPDEFEQVIAEYFATYNDIQKIDLSMTQVSHWNSALLTSILSLKSLCQQYHVFFDEQQLPTEMHRLLVLAAKVPKRDVSRHENTTGSFLHNVGLNVITAVHELGEVLSFLSRSIIALFSVMRGKSVYRSEDTWLVMQQTGAEAMPIVSLLNFLVGAILGYIGAMQLEKFGAEIFIGDMVGVAMTREIAAIITAIIMAGRSGAAFAAQLGTMKVNEEIDALRSMGISPMEFLVLPRMIGMILMMPLLAVYANFMGVFGGALVAYGMLNISLEQYLEVVIKSVGLNDVLAGLIMSVVFGGIVAVVGCQKGMSCGNSAEDVGISTTSAVVTATVIIFVTAAILTVLYGILGL